MIDYVHQKFLQNSKDVLSHRLRIIGKGRYYNLWYPELLGGGGDNGHISSTKWHMRNFSTENCILQRSDQETGWGTLIHYCGANATIRFIPTANFILGRFYINKVGYPQINFYIIIVSMLGSILIVNNLPTPKGDQIEYTTLNLFALIFIYLSPLTLLVFTMGQLLPPYPTKSGPRLCKTSGLFDDC